MAKGIDISHWNGDRLGPAGISTARFLACRAAGYRFAIVKATGGDSFVDPRFTEQWTRAKKAGMKVGAYHYAYPDVGDARAEAGHFVATVRRAVGGWNAGDILPVLDIEVTEGLADGQLVTWVGTFAGEIRELTGRRTMVYTYHHWLTHLAAYSPAEHRTPLWIARYTTAATPGSVDPWARWVAWQWTSSGSPPGMPGATDLNRAPVLDDLLCQRPRRTRPTVGKYTRVVFRGRTVDAYTRAALREVERRLGYTLTITQGSYNTSVDASAGTHAGGGVVDLAAWDHVDKVRTLREVGFYAWFRPAIPNLWGPHIHAVQRGNARLSPAARRQALAYLRGENGLANRGPDNGPRITVPVFRWPLAALRAVLPSRRRPPEGNDDERPPG